MLISTTSITINGKRRRRTVIEIATLHAKKDISTGNPRALERWLAVIERLRPQHPLPTPQTTSTWTVSPTNSFVP